MHSYTMWLHVLRVLDLVANLVTSKNDSKLIIAVGKVDRSESSPHHFHLD